MIELLLSETEGIGEGSIGEDGIGKISTGKVGVSISKREKCTVSRCIDLPREMSVHDEMLTRKDGTSEETFLTSPPFSSIRLRSHMSR